MTSAATIDRLLGPGPRDDAAARARAWLDRHGLPAAGDEAWLYTDVGRLVDALELAAPAAPAAPRLVSRSVVDELAGDLGGPRLVFVNGTHVPDLSDAAVPLAGLRLGALDGANRPATSGEPADGFHALNLASAGHTAVVRTGSGTRSAEPVHVVHLTVPGEGRTVSNPRAVIEVAADSELEVIETYCGVPGTSLTNTSTTIVVGPGGVLRHHRVQHEPADALHIGHTHIELGAGSHARSTTIMLGAELARHALHARLADRGATLDLDGLYLPAAGQRHDTMVTVDHAASGCSSTQRFRGVVEDDGRGSFTGHVIVRPGTVATDARQSNRNLLLGPAAQADTRPWLEILADDVRCTHGATVGRLDDDALFYLRSRGIPFTEGRAMLVAAFAGEITSAITPTSLREHLGGAITTRIGGART